MKRIIVLSLTGLMTVAFAAPAAATTPSTDTPATPVAPVCDTSPSWSYGWDGIDTVSATLDVEEGTVLCDAVTLEASSYIVPITWDGLGFNPSATPQVAIQHKPITFAAGATDSTLSSTLAIPECGPYQVDLYRGPKQDVVEASGSNGFLEGGIVARPACAVVVVDPVAGAAQLAPVPPTCDVDGSLIIVDGPGFIWEEPVELGAGTHLVTANATPGYTFADNKSSVTFEVEVLAATGTTQSTDSSAACFAAVSVPTDLPVTPGTTTPTPTPPGTTIDAVVTPAVVPVAVPTAAVVTAVPTAAVVTAVPTAAVVTAVPTAAVVTAVPTAGPRTLALTGIDGLSWLLAAAAGLIGLGALAVTRTRRQARR